MQFRTIGFSLTVALGMMTVPASAQQPSPAPAQAEPAQPVAIVSEQDWIAALGQTLNRTKTLPAEIHTQTPPGRYRVVLAFKVARDGVVSSVAAKQTSGVPAIDAHAIQSVLKVSPLPAFPAAMTGDSRPFSLPYVFVIEPPPPETPPGKTPTQPQQPN